MDSFEINKIIAAIVVIFVVIFGITKISDIIYYVEKPSKSAYKVEFAETDSAKTSATVESVDIAALLEPLAPIGGILVSDILNDLLIHNPNIYSREYKKIRLNKKTTITSQIYLNFIDWYIDKKNNIGIMDTDKFKEIAKEYFQNFDYSASLKFTNIICELEKNENSNLVNLLFMCENLISIGQLDFADDLINLIKKSSFKLSTIELKGKLIKLEADIYFNKRNLKKSFKLYKESYNIFKNSESLIGDQALFYIILTLLINDNLEKAVFNEYKMSITNPDYQVLLNCIEITISDSDINRCISNVQNIEDERLKAYGYWLLSKFYSKNKNLSKSYEYETIAQETLNNSSLSISDKPLRGDYLLNLLMHQKILNETSVEIDDLIGSQSTFNNNIEDHDVSCNAFLFCVNCGKKNSNSYSECESCGTQLLDSFYNNNATN